MEEKIVWTNGCFDIIHKGHIELFRYAKSLGSKLYVGVDSDSRVRKLKGKQRPINSEEDRRSVLDSIKYIDKTFVFDSGIQLEDLIKQINPSVLVVGSDWRGKDVIGGGHAESVQFFERVGGYSTTKILESIL